MAGYWDATAMESTCEPSAECAGPQTHRKRARSEILRLRAHAEELETRVLLFKRFCEPVAGASSRVGSAADTAAGCGGVGGQPNASAWFQAAAAELSALQKSQRRNRELKREVEAQQRTSAALSELFRHQLSQEDLAFLAEVERQNAGRVDAAEVPATAVASGDVIEVGLPEPLVRIEALYARTDEILAAFANRNTRRTFMTSNFEVDPQLGSVFEHLSNTPVPCGMGMLEQFLWRQIAVITQFDCGRPSHQCSDLSKADCVEKRFSVVLAGTLGKRRMDDEFVVRRYVEPHRVVFVISSLHTFAGSDLVIRQDGHVVISDAGQSPDASGGRSPASASTLVQTVFRVNTNDGGEREVPEDLAEVRDFVLEHMSQNVTKYHHRVQKVLPRAARSGAFTEKNRRDLCIGCVACDLHACSLELTV